MTCVFHVSPFDGGWGVKICDTGEVLFSKTGGEAERQARRLAAACPGPSEVRVHILVNNAARQISQDSILDITTADFDETYKTNVYAMFWSTKAAVPRLKPGSTIMNTASVNA